jgi:hypothetical protein
MTRTFTPRFDILPPAQRALWGELAQMPEHFVLYGDTALALRLGQGDAVEFDLFSGQHLNPAKLYAEIPFLKGAVIIQEEPNTLTCLVDRGGDVKVSFFGLPHIGRLEEPLVAENGGLRVASLMDLAATKVAVVQQRAQAKDYRDIAALIDAGVDLPNALAAAKAVYGDAFQPTPTLKALSYFEDGDLPSLPEEIRVRLVDAVAKVDPLRLPSLNRGTGRGNRG